MYIYQSSFESIECQRIVLSICPLQIVEWNTQLVYFMNDNVVTHISKGVCFNAEIENRPPICVAFRFRMKCESVRLLPFMSLADVFI